jgi:hypothetical protein
MEYKASVNFRIRRVEVDGPSRNLVVRRVQGVCSRNAGVLAGRMRASSLARAAERMYKMRTRLVTVRGLATWAGAAAVLLSIFSAVARGDEDAPRIRWDIQHYPNLILQPGGEAFAAAVNGSKIRLTGSGTFRTDGHDVKGGGTWKTFDPSGTLTGSGTYRVLNLVSWHAAPGALPCPPITDEIAPCGDARAGLAVLQIQYSAGGVGKLVVSCHLPVGSPASVYEGITVSRGFVDYYLPQNPDLTMNGTIFHIVHGDDN